MDKVDYSEVTPATGMDPCDKKIANTYANNMPTSDVPTRSGKLRSDPDKVIPGPEAASAVDDIEETESKRQN